MEAHDWTYSVAVAGEEEIIAQRLGLETKEHDDIHICEGWWTEARNANEKGGMQARGNKQHKLVRETPREFP